MDQRAAEAQQGGQDDREAAPEAHEDQGPVPEGQVRGRAGAHRRGRAVRRHREAEPRGRGPGHRQLQAGQPRHLVVPGRRQLRPEHHLEGLGIPQGHRPGLVLTARPLVAGPSTALWADATDLDIMRRVNMLNIKKLLSLTLALLAAAIPCAFAEAQDGESPDLLHASIQSVIESPEWVANLPAAQDEGTRQLFVVAGMGMDRTTATISMHQRSEDGTWQQILSTPGFVGRNGLCLDADHVEGCGQTPVGVYHFNKAFGIAPDPGCAIPYIQVDEDTYWSGDPDYHYNEMVDIKDYPELAMDDSEHIVHYEYEYQYCLNISFNEDGTPGRGSAIFLHCLGPAKPYTGGCVAIPENIMKLVMQSVTEDCVVVIDTLENMGGSL